jgi:hypothetical protein
MTNAWLSDMWRQERLLMRYTAAMCLAGVFAAILWSVDDRVIRDVNVWVKPMKFMVATALFALTNAAILMRLPQSVRAQTGLHAMVMVLVITSLFEVAYITLQGALGQGSHYNVSSPWMALMFGLMALAAVGLTATQGYLAWVVHRHGLTWGSPLWVRSVVWGLALTFGLATFSGFVLGGLQPPAAQGLPILGWHLSGGDARPAHFLGVHGHQLIPLWGLVVMAGETRGLGARWALALLYGGVALYVLAWAVLAVLGLSAPMA